jgi:hypothetical protein
MKEVLGPRQIELKLHGLTVEDHGRVPARLFATKLKQLVSALVEADKIANGDATHDYVLANMHMSEPTALLKEVPLKAANEGLSAIPVFNDAIEGIKTHDSRTVRLAPVVRRIGLLTGGAETQFGFAEVRTADPQVIRIDDFLRRRAKSAREQAKGNWFDGAVTGSFDGVLDYIDLRGALPQIKLTLSAGGKEVDCICRREDIDALGEALHQRVRVFGRAIYTSSNPLPMRVEVSNIEPIKQGADFSRWKGAFRPFEMDWDGEWEGNA